MFRDVRSELKKKKKKELHDLEVFVSLGTQIAGRVILCYKHQASTPATASTEEQGKALPKKRGRPPQFCDVCNPKRSGMSVMQDGVLYLRLACTARSGQTPSTGRLDLRHLQLAGETVRVHR